MREECIDAHHHLWRYVAEEYPWMTEKMQILRQDYLPDRLNTVAQAAGVTGTVAVQAQQTVAETEWLSEIAAKSTLIRGIVGWAPLADPDSNTVLERLASLPKVKGIRHFLQDEPDDFYMLREDFNRGISLLRNCGLRYDLLIYERHLPQTIEFVDRHPGQIFILDHIAKPRIRERVLSPWRDNLKELARRDNVYCKLSGMVTEANWASWRDEDLQPYFETVLEAFTPGRLMFGSDWPVMTLASSYTRWVETAKQAISRLSAGEQRQVLYETAVEAYCL